MPCRVCGRKSEGELCENHEDARRRVEAGFASWKEAYGDISREEYLDAVGRNPQTGEWAREIAKLLRGAPKS